MAKLPYNLIIGLRIKYRDLVMMPDHHYKSSSESYVYSERSSAYSLVLSIKRKSLVILRASNWKLQP